MEKPENISEKVVAFYSGYDEEGRLQGNWGQVEFIRTKNIISRYLESPPQVILDVGGAAGRYACWLAKEGHEVHLVDPVPLHVQQAQTASDAQPRTPIASCEIGDARRLEFGDEVADVVLLLGPLYHLIDAQDRNLALTEAFRVLKTGGYLFAAGISRFASTIDGLVSGYFLDPEFQNIMRRDLEDGHHLNPTGNPTYFMDTFFHHPHALKAEVSNAGFKVERLLAIEGISYMMEDFDEHWQDENHRQFLLEIISNTEGEQSLIGASPHLMCVGVKV